MALLDASAVSKWANEEFPEDFAALPSVETLAFEELSPAGELLDVSDKKYPLFCPKASITSHLLRVGELDSGTERPEDGYVAYAFLSLENPGLSLKFRYAYKYRPNRYIEITNGHPHILWKMPFCEMLGAGSAYTKVLIDVLVYYYFLGAGHLNEIYRPWPSRFSHTRFFCDNFKTACAMMKNNGRGSLAKPKGIHNSATMPMAKTISIPKANLKPKEANLKLMKANLKPKEIPTPKTIPKLKAMPQTLQPRYDEHESHGTLEHGAGGDQGAVVHQDATISSNEVDQASKTEPPRPDFKRAYREIEGAYNLLAESNKRLKTENRDLSLGNERWPVEKKRLEEELKREKESTQTLEKEVAAKENARTTAEQRAIKAEGRAETAERKLVALESALKREKSITDQAVGKTARLEFELQALKSAQRS
ncbi:hypothetical protein SLS60_008494 [Paraconiothyrium brasiliense]|uniref:Uncharacterized protein n=1 Tax=Paraconiothyrium brasiliense TaxID=300254 RepID=A0ABR3R0R3_9PLEO